MLIFLLETIESDEDKNKFLQVYNKYCRLMIYVANEILCDRQLSEDAVQEAFIKLIKSINGIDNVESYKTKAFVVIVTRNAALDILKKQKKITYFEDIENFDIPDNVDISSCEESEVFEALKKLPDRHKDVLMLKYYYDYSEKTIAELLGISYPAARKRIERAKSVLAKMLRRDEVNV